MVTKLRPLCKVKVLKNDGDQLVVRSPEKAGVGGSTPSLATMFSITCKKLLNRVAGRITSLSWVQEFGQSTAAAPDPIELVKVAAEAFVQERSL